MKAYVSACLIAAVLSISNLYGQDPGRAGGAPAFGSSMGRMDAGGTIQGRVVKSDGRPAAFATVRATGNGGMQQATTDSEGKFQLADLKPGV